MGTVRRVKVPFPVLDAPVAAARTVVELSETGGPLARGNGPHLYVCGACGRVLADGIEREILGGVVVRCRCGALNETASLPPSGES
jgi:hypothetical protein